jgi:hypothetical protein
MCSPSPPACFNSYPSHRSQVFHLGRVRGVREMGLDVVEIGMGSDLSLDLTHFAASKAVRQTANVPASDVDAYIRRLQEEQGKIEVFKRELPICASLLADG